MRLWLIGEDKGAAAGCCCCWRGEGGFSLGGEKEGLKMWGGWASVEELLETGEEEAAVSPSVAARSQPPGSAGD